MDSRWTAVIEILRAGNGRFTGCLRTYRGFLSIHRAITASLNRLFSVISHRFQTGEPVVSFIRRGTTCLYKPVRPVDNAFLRFLGRPVCKHCGSNLKYTAKNSEDTRYQGVLFYRDCIENLCSNKRCWGIVLRASINNPSKGKE